MEDGLRAQGRDSAQNHSYTDRQTDILGGGGVRAGAGDMGEGSIHQSGIGDPRIRRTNRRQWPPKLANGGADEAISSPVI